MQELFLQTDFLLRIIFYKTMTIKKSDFNLEFKSKSQIY